MRPKFTKQDKQLSDISEIIRVNHAGEYGAKVIYETQIKYIKDPIIKQQIQAMHHEEVVHLEYFNSQIINRKIRPTVLMPIWRIGGSFLGYITAKMGTKYAMLCTQEIESVIEKHYNSQISALDHTEQELKDTIHRFNEDEIHHKNHASTYVGQLNHLDNIFSKTIRTICKLAINLSKKY
jgi:ubiquinone biosynthesis monooxygenase Coq7